MNDSILTSIKKLLGITEECKDFDMDLIIHINSVFVILNQLGVGSSFFIEDETATWNKFIDTDDDYAIVKSYVFLKVKLLFDPPLSSAVMECYKANISELEWRLNMAAELKQSSDDDNNNTDVETYTGSYNITPQAFNSQTLDTSGKIMSDDLHISEVPFYQTSNQAGGVTSYIAKEA
jgi:hypothetical protein